MNPSTSIPTPVIPPPARKPRRVRWLAALGVAGIAFALLLSPLTETPEQREFSRALDKVGSVFDRGANAKTFSAKIELLRSEGVPKLLANFKGEVAIAAPDRLWLDGIVDKQRFELARNGQEIWIWEPAKAFGVVCAAAVAKCP